MQVELHPLVRGSVLPARLLRHLIDSIGFQHKVVVVKPPQGKPPLNLKPLPLLHLSDNGLGLLPLHKPGNPNGTGEVGDIKAHHPSLAAGELPVLYVEYLALHQHAAHVQRQFVHGYGLLLPADLAVYLFNPLISLSGRWGIRAQQFAPHRLHLCLQIAGRFLNRGRRRRMFGLPRFHCRLPVPLRQGRLIRIRRRRISPGGVILSRPLHSDCGGIEAKGPFQTILRLGKRFT